MQFQHSHIIISKNPLVLMSNNTSNTFNLWSQAYSKYSLLLLIISAILISGLISPIANAADPEDSIHTKATLAIEVKREYLKYIVSQQERLVTSLVESPFMRSYVSDYNEPDRESLTELFLTAATINKYYMQVRFIDELGKEKIRIEQSTTGLAPMIVKETALQDKSNRKYFIEMKKTLVGNLWHSPFDLNRELGKIEQVPNPTYRISSPVYLEGKFKGMVIINLDMTYVTQHLMESPDFLIYLADANNNVLVHPNPKKSWSKYLTGRSQYQPTAEDSLSNTSQSLEDIFKNGEGIRIILEPIEATSAKAVINTQ